jgi:hypothetical protein
MEGRISGRKVRKEGRKIDGRKVGGRKVGGRK